MRSFVIFKVFRPKQKIILAMLLALLVGAAVYPYYASSQENRAVEALSWTVASKIIVVDPGHGGIDPGCVGKSGVREKDINLAIAKRLSTYLKQAGATVVMTREGDYDLSEEGKAPSGVKHKDDLAARAELAELYQADLFISVHVNSIPLTECWGPQVFYHPDSKDSKRLAALMQKELNKAVGDSGRWVKPEDFFVLRGHKCTSAIVEVGFLSNPKEEKLLGEPIHQNKLAWSIYAGVVRYFAGDPLPKDPEYD